MRAVPPLAVLIAALAAPAAAQPFAPYIVPYGAYPGGAPAAIADQHRYENDRLRNQAQAGAALARQLDTEARLRQFQIQAARAPELTPAPAPRPLYSPEQERALADSAAARRAQTQQGVRQIDDWLDGPK